jgi:hypothetical protein
MNTKRKAGRIVQIVSISCPSSMFLLKFFVYVDENIRFRVIIVINVRMIIE